MTGYNGDGSTLASGAEWFPQPRPATYVSRRSESLLAPLSRQMPNLHVVPAFISIISPIQNLISPVPLSRSRFVQPAGGSTERGI